MSQKLLIDSFPLSPMQQGMLFHYLKEPHSGFDVEQLVVYLPEAVDARRLEAAWQWLVQRHDILRARFMWKGIEQPRQEIVPEVSVPFVVEDARQLPGSAQHDRLTSFLEADRVHGFELDRAPMLRLTLFQWGEASFSLAWTFHHALLDGRCYPLLLREVFEVYEELGRDGIKERPAPFSYRRYIDWLQQKDFSKSEVFWKELLAGFSSPTPLIIDRLMPNDTVGSQQGESWESLDSKTTAKLRDIVEQNGLTMNALVMGSWAILLHRYSGEEDVVFGATRACRRSSVEHADDTIGLFINTVPIRVRLNAEERAISVVQALRQEWLDIRPHEHTPLTLVKAASQVPPAEPLFESLVVFENQQLDQAMRSLGGHWANRQVELHELTNFPVTLAAYGGNELSFKIVFNRFRLDESIVRRMLGHFRRLLEGLAANAQTAVCDLPLITGAEQQQLLVDWNSTKVIYPESSGRIHELIEAQVSRTPDHIAIVVEQQKVTYRALNQRANQLAQHLRILGVGPDVLVGLCVERSVEMVVGLLGILKAGGAYVPLDPSFPDERLTYMVEDSGIRVLVTHRGYHEKLPVRTISVVDLDSAGDNIASESVENLNLRETSPADLAYVLYTSGSTGQPKGVCIEHRNIVNYVLGITERLHLTSGMNLATVSTIAADLGNTVIFPALAVGGCLHVIGKERAENQAGLAEYFDREGIDLLKVVPSHLAALQTARNPERVMPRCCLILGGEASRLKWIEQLRAWAPHCEIYNHYGPTETTVGVLTFRVGPQVPGTLSGTLPLGKPLPNSRVYILDRRGQPVPIGVPGELCIGGRGVARGYLNRSDLTLEKFVADPFTSEPKGRLYRTGDRARYLPDGNVEFLGRLDHQVKVRGYRVELGEVEAVLRAQPGVRDAVVTAREDPSGTKQLIAYVIPKRLNQPLWGSNSVYILPDGSPVAHLNKNETDYIYKEVFGLQAYLRHGVTISDGDCIVDAGANIGMFTIFASRLARDLRVYSFEPNPSVFKCLKANAEAWGAAVKCFPVGLSRSERTAEMSFFEGFSLLSGFYADAAKEREVVRNYVLNQQSGSPASARMNQDIEQLIDERFRARTITAPLRTLSGVMAEEGIDRIDLLKINVEKSELDVLHGLQPGDWEKIRQMVIEVDLKENLEPITTLLERHGYEIFVEQDSLLRKTELCYVYAIRPSAKGRLIGHQPDQAHIRGLPPADEAVLTVPTLRKCLHARLPQYMVPSVFVALETLPLTVNGKVDRKALPAPSFEQAQASNDFVEPRTETEKALAVIWSNILKVERIGIHDDFFDVGGHSLLVIRAVSQIRDLFTIDLSPRTFFTNPTISGLARVLGAAQGSGGDVQRIDPRTQSGPYPLSFAQERMWFFDQLVPGSPAYNIVDVIRFEGAVDAEAMRRAIKELARRHESLRTAFPITGGGPVQVVHPAIDVSLPELDLRAWPEQEREREWMRVAQAAGRTPFDLSQPPLMRWASVQLPQEHLLLLTIHHIVADEWSMEVFHKELHKIYEAYSQGEELILPDLPIQYTDFACWQRDWLQGDVLQRQIAYWKEALTGAPARLELPTDKPRPAAQSFNGSTEIFELPKSLLERLKALGREEQATLFMTLAAGFMALMHRYTGQNDVLIGTPISGRTRSEVERLIGLFLNTVVLRGTFTKDLTFRALLQQIRETALGAYGHQDLPFEQLVAELAPERTPSHSPLFQVMFILNNAQATSQASNVAGLRQLETATSKFDLTLYISEGDGGLSGLMEYSTDLFEASTIRRMCGHYKTLLEAIVHNPDRSISTVSMLPEAERQQLLVNWNNTEVVYSERFLHLHELIESQVSKTPDRVALVVEQQNVTYRELNQRANQLAHHLKRLGVGPDVLVGLCVERSVEMVVGLLGILKAGGAYVPLDPSFPLERLTYMVEDSGMRVLVTHRDYHEKLPLRAGSIVNLDSDGDSIATGNTENLKLHGASSGDLAYVLYTSGSTGKPKGVEIPHSALVNFLLAMQREPGFTSADRLLALTTLSFDIAGLELYLPLISGGTVVLASRTDTQDPARLSEGIRTSHCNVIQATPATWWALIHVGWTGSATLKLLCGGEALPQDLARELLSRCAELWNMYGPTETTIWSTIHRVTTADGPAPIGRPIANTQVFVLDANRNILPVGAIGELHIGGLGLAHGYLGRSTLTQERFIQSPFGRNERLYCTGDLARWLPDGTLECLGRVDHQVKIRGYRIELGEVEAVLSTHEAVRQCVAAVYEKNPGHKVLVAYFEPKAGLSPSVGDLRAHLKKELPDYMVPSSFVAMATLPLTPNGKVNRKALTLPDDASIEVQGEFVAPRDSVEQQLAHLWAKVLRVKHVGLRDNFFDLGGHSLLAVRIVVEIEKLYNRRLPLATLLQAPTVGELAEVLRRENWKPWWSSLVPLRPGGSRPPLFLMHAHGGNVLEYYPLANHLDKDQPVYAIQARGLDGNIVSGESMESIASAYVKELRSLQPEGPYILGGFCFGGLLAMEAAQQLMAAGEEVALLILIQTIPPAVGRFRSDVGSLRRWLYRTTTRIAIERERVFAEGRRYFSERFWRAVDLARARTALGHNIFMANRLANRTAHSLPYILELMRIKHDQVAETYAPRPYGGDVLLFRASKLLPGLAADSAYLGWRSLLHGNLEILELPGHQQTLLLEPKVSRLAKELTTRLKSVQ